MKNKIKKYLIGASAVLSIGGGSVVFTYTADGCNVEYVQVRDASGILTPADKNGNTTEGKF
jgi:hypothetical protein